MRDDAGSAAVAADADGSPRALDATPTHDELVLSQRLASKRVDRAQGIAVALAAARAAGYAAGRDDEADEVPTERAVRRG